MIRFSKHFNQKLFYGCLLLNSVFGNSLCASNLPSKIKKETTTVISFQHETKKTIKATDFIDITPTPASLKAYPPKTDLSKKALHLKIGMSKNEVLKLLGNPTWADSKSEVPLAWAWHNGHCNPVNVSFDKNMEVTGFDEGRAVCFEADDYQVLPDKDYLCTNEEQKNLCE
jgi:hypothetical protein